MKNQKVLWLECPVRRALEISVNVYDSSSVIRQVVLQILEHGHATPETIQGCSMEEVAKVESKFQIHLPRMYREFLLVMGRRAGDFYRGADLFFPLVLELREWAEELLTEDGSQTSLPQESFVFLMDQGYQFMFFLLEGSAEDPAVWHYHEVTERRS